MLSIPDMAVLGAVALLLFGPDKLPTVAKKAGKVVRDLQNTSQSFIREMERAADHHEAPHVPTYEPPAYDATVHEVSPAPEAPVHDPYGLDLAVEPPPAAAHVAPAGEVAAHQPRRGDASEPSPY